MKALLSISLELYRILESHCVDKSHEFRLLRSGVIEEDRAHVVIRCETDDALKLCAWANDCSKGAAAQMRVVLDG